MIEKRGGLWAVNGQANGSGWGQEEGEMGNGGARHKTDDGKEQKDGATKARCVVKRREKEERQRTKVYFYISLMQW